MKGSFNPNSQNNSQQQIQNLSLLQSSSSGIQGNALCGFHNIDNQYFCVTKDCDQKSRLACGKCFALGPHNGHEYQTVQKVNGLLKQRLESIDVNYEYGEYLELQISEIKTHFQKLRDQIFFALREQEETFINQFKETFLFYSRSEYSSFLKQSIDVNQYRNKNQHDMVLEILLHNAYYSSGFIGKGSDDRQSQGLQNVRGKGDFQNSKLIQAIRELDPQNTFIRKTSKYLSDQCSRRLKCLEDRFRQFEHNILELGNLQYEETEETFNLDTFLGKQLMELGGHTMEIWDVKQISESHFASCSQDKTIIIWNIDERKEMRRLIGHTDGVLSLESSPHLGYGKQFSSLLVSGSRDRTIRVWDWNKGTCMQTLSGHKDSVKVLLCLGEDILASGGYDNLILLWNLKTGERLFILNGHEEQIRDLKLFSKQQLVSCANDGTVRVWNIQKGVQERVIFIQIQQEDDEKILGILQVNENLAVVCQSINIQIWDIVSSRRLKSVIAHSDFIQRCLKLTSNDFATISQDGCIAIWAIRAGDIMNIELVRKLQFNQPGLALCKFNENKIIAGYNRGIAVWL